MNTSANPPRRSDTGLMLICVTVLVAIVVAGAVAAYIFGPEDGESSSLITTIVAVLAPTVAAMAAVIKVGAVSGQVADVQEDTTKLANGLGDAKIRAAMADVLPDHLVDPAAKPQLEADRLRRLLPEEHG